MPRRTARDILVEEADLEIRSGISKAIKFLELDEWPDILYHTAEIKLVLLKEMGSSVEQAVPIEGIPDARRVISSAIYSCSIEYGLTNAELYRIITEWELREAYGMIKAERSGDSEG